MTQNRATFNCWGGEFVFKNPNRGPLVVRAFKVMLTEIEYWAYIDNIHTYIIYVDTDLTLPVVWL